jgi:DNA-binding SARP family transcriptional activator
MAELDFRLFGPVRAIGPDGTERALGPRKERAVPAMLLIQPGRVLPLDRPSAVLAAVEAGDEPRARELIAR